MQALCQLEAQGDEALADLPAFLEEEGASGETFAHAARLARDAWTRRALYDEWIARVSAHWRPERMSVVERNVLRIATMEMLEGLVPPKVAMDEAIEIGREFGGAETPRFINGLLDAVYRRMRDETGIDDAPKV